MINYERMLRVFIDLVRLDTPPGAERPVVDYLRPRLEALGAQIEEDDAHILTKGNAGNLIARFEGVTSAPTLMFSSHMDTVAPTPNLQAVLKLASGESLNWPDNGQLPDSWMERLRQVSIHTDETTILGADDKAGIAIIMEALHVLKETKQAHAPLEIVFTVAEETGLWGARHIRDRDADLNADFAYILDTGGAPGTVVHTAPTQDNIQFSIKGQAAHAGIAPEAGINAIQVASRAIAQMPLGRIDEETTANVGIIHGGQATNIIPDLVSVQGEARSRSPQKLQEQVNTMKQAVYQAAEAQKAKVEWQTSRSFDGFLIPTDAPIVELLKRAAEKITLPLTIKHGGGGSDGNVYNNWRIPSLVLGLGYREIHSPQEHIALSDMVRTCELMLSLAAVATEGGR